MKLPQIKPPALRPGDLVGIAAPASNVKRAELEAGCLALQQAGYRTFFFDSIFEQDLYFAGSVERRVRELESMFAREDIRAVICARGGYGSNYLLQSVDWKLLASHPKIFVGYSDLTCLLTHLTGKFGLVTFHGPMVAKDWAHEGGIDVESWTAAVTGAAEWEAAADGRSGATALVEGSAEATLCGGCLSILVASLGTPYEIETQETILFIEDVAAKPYQIDRMLMQLKLAGKLKNVKGIIFGEMVGCVQNVNQGYTLQEVILRIVGDMGIPVAYGLRSGHVSSGNITLPFGVRASLKIAGGRVGLRVEEAAVLA